MTQGFLRIPGCISTRGSEFRINGGFRGLGLRGLGFGVHSSGFRVYTLDHMVFQTKVHPFYSLDPRPYVNLYHQPYT